MGTISIEYNVYDPLIRSPCWIWMNLGLREALKAWSQSRQAFDL